MTRLVFLIIFTLHFYIQFCQSDVLSYYRLDRNVLPKTYEIKISPDLDNSTFEGEVTINLHVKYKTHQLILHSKNLTITQCNWDFTTETIKQHFDKTRDILILKKSNGQEFETGSHVLFLQFQGRMTNDSGLTKVEYTHYNRTGVIVASDLQPSLARTVYPCFDEPFFKANFIISIGVPNNTYFALSNMKNIGVYNATGNKKVYKFQKSPKMSTYLTAFIVTDYPFHEKIWNNSGILTPVRIYSPFIKESLNDSDLLLNHTTQFLEYLTNYTGIKYPLPKIDMIEYNRTIAATENWGLITFGNGLLSLSQKIFDINQTAEVIAHEISHSWFGNLVTVDWWTDIWLQEGFSSFFSAKTLNAVFNSNNKLTDYYEYRSIFANDKNGSLPVVRALESVDQISKQFRSLIYVKGKIVLSMLELAIGPDNFQKVMRRFLKLYEYKVATTDGFISCVEEVVPDFDSRGFLVSWLYQNLYPIVYVRQENGTYFLKQEVYNNSNLTTKNPLRYKWTIPLTYVTDKKKYSTILFFHKETETLTLNVPKDTKWIIFNPGGTGLYRFNYTDFMWNSLIENFQEIPKIYLEPLTREAFVLFYAGEINCSVVFRILIELHKENSKLASYILEKYAHVVLDIRNYVLRTDETVNEKITDFSRKVFLKNDLISDELFEDESVRLMEYPKCLERLGECTIWIKENL